jgi:hypothetical protein
MKYSLCSLELHLEVGDYGLSARRLWEHTELGQINVFDHPISARQELNDPAAFIDVVQFVGETFSLLGLTLAELQQGKFPRNSQVNDFAMLLGLTQAPKSVEFVAAVASHLNLCSLRQALRNQHHQFLPSAKSGDVFGVPYLYSRLQRTLLGMGKSKANAEQWFKTIENFQKKGLRTEELECSELLPELLGYEEGNELLSASFLSSLCIFKDFRFSVFPVVHDAESQLRFASAPERALKKTKKLAKPQTGQTRAVAGFDPVLGYRIEHVEHQTLWGADSHWQAVMHDGQVIRDTDKQTLFQSREIAASLAADHAKQNFPKRVALGRWGRFAWTGGKEYREWLITLPYYPANYLSGHFEVRNILAHVRCDVREGVDGERVLMLHEVQSDWAQGARREMSHAVTDMDDETPPLFMKEWPALVMKLVFLHAAYEGLDAVAWTQGAHQVLRYKGLGATGLKELYDRTLPREVNRLLKPLGGVCEPLGVYVPTNFGIKQSERGYEVYSPDNELLGISATIEDARQFVPDGAHELLYEVHGVRLPQGIRKAILETGFPAWG